MSFKNQVRKMKQVEQIQGIQSVYDHGVQVRHHLFNLIAKVKKSTEGQDEFKLKPLLPYLYDIKILSRYTLYHDIGKSECFTKDEKG